MNFSHGSGSQQTAGAVSPWLKSRSKKRDVRVSPRLRVAAVDVLFPEKRKTGVFFRKGSRKKSLDFIVSANKTQKTTIRKQAVTANWSPPKSAPHAAARPRASTGLHDNPWLEICSTHC